MEPWDKRLFDYLYEQVEHYPQQKSVGAQTPSGWHFWSSEQLRDEVRKTSLGLIKAGIQPGDKVATVVFKTIPEWVALDQALLQIGAMNVPMYPTISPSEYAYILKESGVKLCVVGDDELYAKVKKASGQAPDLQGIFSFYSDSSVAHWRELQADEGDEEELERRKAAVKPEDIATIIYTSGTTGNPKGVMLTHRNIAYNVESLRSIVNADPGERVISFLPVSHIFERAAVYYFLAIGAQVHFTDTNNLGGDDGDLRSVKPHFFTTVPRLLEKVYDKILAKGYELKQPKKAIFFWALNIAEHWDFNQKRGFLSNLSYRIVDRLVFSKWREALGGQVRGIVTGASACPERIMRVFNAAGIRIREGYGLTEAAPALAVNRFDEYGALAGTVGPLLEGTRVAIVPLPNYSENEGEILSQSPGVMQGYYKNPEKTSETLVQYEGETWLATGDIGKMIKGPDGREFLQITDRKKELLKTSGGKYVAPAPIETALKAHFLVEFAMVVGEQRKFVSALIVPSEEGLREWCARHEVPWTSFEDALARPEVNRRFEMLMERINPGLSKVEQIKKFALVSGPWETIKSDGIEAELTPTLKLKRRVIREKYAGVIDNIYATDQA